MQFDLWDPVLEACVHNMSFCKEHRVQLVEYRTDYICKRGDLEYLVMGLEGRCPYIINGKTNWGCSLSISS